MTRAKGIPALELYRLAQKKRRKLVLCGHSLGGAVCIFFLNQKNCFNYRNLYLSSELSLSLIICSGSSSCHPRYFEGYCCCVKRNR